MATIRKLQRKKGIGYKAIIKDKKGNHICSKTFDRKFDAMAWAKKNEVMQEDKEGKFYPNIPNMLLTPLDNGFNLPASSGIYFIWDGDKIVYIGKSINLAKRLKIGHHHILEKNHKISFLLFDKEFLTWAECFYIGIAKPYKNFGSMASHYVEKCAD